MTTSLKHNNFINESMKDKVITVLPGIGEVLGKRLTDEGFEYTETILGQYLTLKRHKGYFQDWMKEICSANCKQSSDCYEALHAWREANL